MGKIHDIEKEKQKAKNKAKESPPPIICLRSKDGKTRIIPKMEKGPDGKWRIKDLEAIKVTLGYHQEETDEEEEPEGP